jgi:regulator of replication initiation timing
MKENKKYLKAELTRQIAKQFSDKVKKLENKISELLSEKKQLSEKLNNCLNENNDLKTKNQQLEKSQNKLTKLLSMSEDERKTYMEELETRNRLGSMVEKYSSFIFK